jgi:hypothetical protein
MFHDTLHVFFQKVRGRLKLNITIKKLKKKVNLVAWISNIAFN